MTPKDKSKELIDKFYQTTPNESFYNPPIGSITSAKYTSYGQAIQCALISVEEIINSSPSLPILSESGNLYSDIKESKSYWEKVKNELLKQQNN